MLIGTFRESNYHNREIYILSPPYLLNIILIIEHLFSKSNEQTDAIYTLMIFRYFLPLYRFSVNF